MTASFALMGSIASNLQTISEPNHRCILSLNLKRLAKCVDNLKIILISQNEILLLMLFCKRVLKQREEF